MFLASMGMGAATTGASLYGQHQEAKAMGRHQRDQMEAHNNFRMQTAEAANRAHDDNITQELERSQVHRDEAARDTQQITREKMEAQAEAINSSQGAGLSLDMLMRDYEVQAGNYKDSVGYNLAQQKRQSVWKMNESEAGAKAGANRTQPFMSQPIQQPDYLSATLGMLGSGLQSHGNLFK